jgi:isovaleryl-CoA dehydrogenase
MRGSNTCELVFNDCRVPKENILGIVNKGIDILMKGLNYERVVLVAGPVGIMKACLDIVLPYVHQREQFGKAIGEFELIQAKIADMYAALSASQAFLYQVARNCDENRITRQDAAALILFTAENATRAASDTIQCLGGNGYTNEYAAGRLWRDAKLYEIGAGTSEIRRILIGRELFNQFN